MANDEHLAILKKGVKEWNRWRNKNPDKRPDLSGDTSLSEGDLSRANLSEADLSRANLNGADLSVANLSGAILAEAILAEAILSRAILSEAILSEAILTKTILTKANLSDANLRGANLNEAHLSDADPRRADLSGADLGFVNLSGADLQFAAFADVDLSEVLGLEQVSHLGPSSIGTDTLVKSKGKIPEAFLRGCGLTDWEIQTAKLWDPDLTRDEITDITYEVVNLKALSPIALHHVFISYSHADSTFVEKLEAGLDNKRIRYWRDVHDMKAGRLESQIEKAIRVNPLVLLVLSELSVKSDWVEWEVSKARELEKLEKRDVLCPIALDDAWKTCDWPGPLRRQVMDYNILDFSERLKLGGRNGSH